MRDLLKNQEPKRGFRVDFKGGELDHIIWALKIVRLKDYYFGLKDKFNRTNDVLISKLGKALSAGKKTLK